MNKKKSPLVWNAWNRDHINKHKVTVKETEDAYAREVGRAVAKFGRTVIHGKTKGGRWMAIILSFERQKQPYVVSARDMNKKERSLYESISTKTD